MFNTKSPYFEGAMIFGLHILIVAIAIFAVIDGPYIGKHLPGSDELEYVTEINGIDEDAEVYKSNKSVPETAKYIVYLVSPMANSGLKNRDNIELFYKNEYVLIYRGRNGDTYVQYSYREYIYKNGHNNIYKPYNEEIKKFFKEIYTSSKYYKEDLEKYSKTSNSQSK